MGWKLDDILINTGLVLAVLGASFQLTIENANYESKNTPSLRNTIINYAGVSTSALAIVSAVAGYHIWNRKFKAIREATDIISN